MCDVRKKLILFDYAISKFADWKKEQKNVSLDEALNSFSTTQLMKLMYLVCLQCVTEQQNSYTETPFSKLDKWIAYKNGPVEDDVYWSLSYLPTIQKNVENPYRLRNNNDSGKIETYFYINNIDFSNSESVRKELIIKYNLSEDINLIDTGIKNIIKKENFPFDDIDKLIRISHSGMLWRAAQHNEEKKMSTDNIYLLREEKKKIDDYTLYIVA
jgi:hypothetical protein